MGQNGFFSGAVDFGMAGHLEQRRPDKDLKADQGADRKAGHGETRFALHGRKGDRLAGFRIDPAKVDRTPRGQIRFNQIELAHRDASGG